ncbi:MAG TPA: RagB/SusD family nutrient uptake outer membrane protein, partial [Cyclobacteriaceae bacterium]|nr:RagB/SusD family nutrient uptake outer membrane protein [Cyclobacteriaceae bacterium]
EEEAKIYINKIRNRAGLPPVTATGDALVERYRHERRIELVFEDHRFFDVRRWMIAPEAYTDAQGISIIHKLNPDRVTTTPTYTLIPSVEDRAWRDRFYFIPIAFDEMNNNKNLIQNPLYE